MRSKATELSGKLNWIIELVVGGIMAALVLDVWIGVMDRYMFHWQLPWPEALARYLMIWVALLAISCGIYRNEHIGLYFVLNKLPAKARKPVLIALDFLALALFGYLFWFGIEFAVSGAKRNAMIFGLSLAPAFAAVPVAAGIAALQVILKIIGRNDSSSVPPQTQGN